MSRSNPERAFALHKWFVQIVAVEAAVSVAVALNALRVAPKIDDLYNVVYDNSRLSKPEDTYLFLFGFPAMLAIAAIVNLLFRNSLVRRSVEKSRLPVELQLAFAYAVTAIFFCGSLHRSFTVLRMYG